MISIGIRPKRDVSGDIIAQSLANNRPGIGYRDVNGNPARINIINIQRFKHSRCHVSFSLSITMNARLALHIPCRHALISSTSAISQRISRPANLVTHRNHFIMSGTSGRNQLVSDVVKEDHRELEDYYSKLTSLTDHDQLARYQNLLTWELARHSVGEELVLYPFMERVLPNGLELTSKDREDHQKVRGGPGHSPL
jgi:hypothetical protein